MKIGFLINPIAGLGGTVALKGTDGLAKQALQLGAKPVSPVRAESFFETLDKACSNDIRETLEFYCPPAPMGEQVLAKFSFKYKIIPMSFQTQDTTAEDTKTAIKLFEKEQVDAIIFVGGDGTSVDVGTTIANETPILGIPSGVKTYGSVFSHTPEEAVTILLSFHASHHKDLADLLDLDEQAYKQGIISISLKGSVFVPAYPQYFQNAKERVQSSDSEIENLNRIAEEVIETISTEPGKKLVIIGSGSTFTPLGEKLRVERSVLGVDCFEYSENGSSKTLVRDAREDQIYDLLSHYTTIFLLLTPIGGMGYILGRGNHQISPRILKCIPKEHLLICCSSKKLATLKDGVLRIDTPNKEFNLSMTGFIKVIIDIDQRTMIRVVH